MGRGCNTDWKQEVVTDWIGTLNPGRTQASRLLGNFEMHGPLGFLLHQVGPRKYSAILQDVDNADTQQIAVAKLAVDWQVERSQNASTMFEFKPDAYGPAVFQPQGTFRPMDFPLFHGCIIAAVLEWHSWPSPPVNERKVILLYLLPTFREPRRKLAAVSSIEPEKLIAHLSKLVD